MGKGVLCSEAEAKAIITVCIKAYIQQELEGAARNKVIDKKSLKCLKDAGCDKGWIQCRAKVKHLKRPKKVKDNNDQSGRARNACQHFEKLDTIVGSQPATQP